MDVANNAKAYVCTFLTIHFVPMHTVKKPPPFQPSSTLGLEVRLLLPPPSLATAAATLNVASRLRNREKPIQYAESSRKRTVATTTDNTSFPDPDSDLGDYISTFFQEVDPQSSLGAGSSLLPSRSTYVPPPSHQQQQEMVELDADAWNSLYGGSVVAVAPPVPPPPPASESAIFQA